MFLCVRFARVGQFVPHLEAETSHKNHLCSFGGGGSNPGFLACGAHSLRENPSGLRANTPFRRPVFPSAFGLTLFPHSCHGFCGSFVAAQPAPAPCLVKSSGAGYLSSNRPGAKRSRDSDTAKRSGKRNVPTQRKLTAQPSSRLCYCSGPAASVQPQQPFLGSGAASTPDRNLSTPLSSDRYPLIFEPSPKPPPSEKLAAVAARPSGSPAGGMVFFSTLGKIRPESSNVWKKNGCRLSLLPTLGTISSNLWKLRPCFFQRLEPLASFFPLSGKLNLHCFQPSDGPPPEGGGARRAGVGGHQRWID